MIERSIVQNQLEFTLKSTDLSDLGEKYQGKVRDCYIQEDQRFLITTDRLSAFDVVLTTIPFKGHLLNEMAAYWFEETEHIVPNHVIERPHPNVFVTREVEIIPIEVVVRGYLAGSAWRDYEAGRTVSGVQLPQGLRRSHKLEKPILTPSTKADLGTHDEPISTEEVVSSGIVEEKLWNQISDVALELFDFGTKKAAERGLILVDTKYEFGLSRGPGARKLILADEIHTQDSSRYWMLSSYQDRFEEGEDPEMLDKEFVRRWLIEQGYMGDGTPPEFPDSFRVDTALRYMEACEKITGRTFEAESGSTENHIAQALSSYTKKG